MPWAPQGRTCPAAEETLTCPPPSAPPEASCSLLSPSALICLRHCSQTGIFTPGFGEGDVLLLKIPFATDYVWQLILPFWRRLLRVLWTARRSNQSILKEINPECSLERLMLKVKLQYFGHLMRKTDSLEKTLMLGKTEGKRRRGWQRMRWLVSIMDSMDMNFNKLGEAWSTAVHWVTKSWTWLSDWTITTIWEKNLMKKKIDICICITDSLRCTSETNTPLY